MENPKYWSFYYRKMKSQELTGVRKKNTNHLLSLYYKPDTAKCLHFNPQNHLDGNYC